MNVLKNENIICVSSVDWEPLWTRKQQVMSRLPVSNRILYVEPPISLLSPFKDPACWQKWKTWFQGIRNLNKNIFLLSPPVILPFGNIYEWINNINQKIIARSIRKAARRLGMKRPILWTYLHTSAPLPGTLGEQLVVYDCVDEHSAYQGFNPDTVKSMERKLLARADIVFVTARGLYEDKKDYCQEIHLSPNAADVEHFMKADSPDTPLASELEGLPHPILGFVGAIKEWIDLDLLQRVAQEHPDGSLVMVGPVGTGIDISSLQEMPNVYLLGHRDRSRLPQYLKGFDVCLNPFRLNRLTETVSPLKFYEYLASGRPIVSVPMAEISDFSDVIEFGEGPEGFLAAINRALQDTDSKKQARFQRARQNGWENRVAFMMDKIGARLENAQQPERGIL